MVGVSIVIPCWNHEFFLPRSVGSALRAIRILRDQGLPGEVVVIDDQSRDGGPTLLRQFEALYFGDGLRVFSLAANQGPAGARNFGLRLARFRYVQYLDADNEIIAENLPAFLKSIEETGAAAVYGNLILPTKLVSNESFQPRIFNDNYVDTMSLVDRQQILDAGGFLLDHGFEDWEMNLHLASLGRKIVFVPLAMGWYHPLPGSQLNDDKSSGAAQVGRFRRCFNQTGLRANMPLNALHLRYHPAIGML